MLMTDEQKTNYLRISLALSKAVIDNRTAELIWRSYEGIIQKQGQWSLEDQAYIEVLVHDKYDNLDNATKMSKKERKKAKKKAKEEA